MKKFESIYNLEKFGKTELSKVKGGLKATSTNNNTNTPRAIDNGQGNGWGYGVGNGNGIGNGIGGGTIMNNFDSDDDDA